MYQVNAQVAKGVEAFLKQRKIKQHTIRPVSPSLLPYLEGMIQEGIYGSMRNYADRVNQHEYKFRKTSTGTSYRIGRPSFLHNRLRPDGVCPTITGDAKKYHPSEPRFLSVEEQAALGGWPASFKFVGTVNQQYAQVAKAVQPATASYIAQQLSAIDYARRVKKPVLEILDYRPLVKGKELVHIVVR